MNSSEAKVGTPVETLREFVSVPKGTKGVIDEDYGTGIMVAWDLPDRPLPEGYTQYDGKPQFAPGTPLRDGFDKQTELGVLAKVKE